MSEPVKHPMSGQLRGAIVRTRDLRHRTLELVRLKVLFEEAAAELDRLAGIEAERDAAQAKWKGCEGLQWVTCKTCKGLRRVISSWEYAGAMDCSKCLGTGKLLRKVEGGDHADAE